MACGKGMVGWRPLAKPGRGTCTQEALVLGHQLVTKLLSVIVRFPLASMPSPSSL